MFFRRVLWLAIILAALVLYFPINRVAKDGLQLMLPIDQFIPLYPPAIVPYLLGNILFIAFPIWAAIYAKPIEFESYTISILLVTAISYIIFLVFPTFVVRPDITSQDIFSKTIVTLYRVDRAYNAAPSGHTFYALLSFLYLERWRPMYKLVWLVFAVLIIVSTLLTKQHYVLDLISGLVLGILAYVTGRFVRSKRNLRFASGE